MSIVVTDDKHYKNIADKLRARTGLTNKIKPENMAYYVDIAYQRGQSSTWDEFWDSMQGEGRRSNYTGAFEGIGWTEVTLKPKYNMRKIQYASRMFRMCRVEQSFDDYFWNMGIEISFSQCVQMDSCFASSFWTKIDYLETELCDNLEYLFSGCTKLTKVGLYLKNDGSQNLYNTFNKCSALTDVSIYYGKIGFDGVDFSGCPNLTVQSLVNIFNALMTSSSSPIIKIGSTNLAKLSAEQKAIATNKGWKLK